MRTKERLVGEVRSVQEMLQGERGCCPYWRQTGWLWRADLSIREESLRLSTQSPAKFALQQSELYRF